jgi:hypothetical protein
MGDHADDLMWQEMSRLIDPDNEFYEYPADDNWTLDPDDPEQDECTEFED